jgi:hypothetical protein
MKKLKRKTQMQAFKFHNEIQDPVLDRKSRARAKSEPGDQRRVLRITNCSAGQTKGGLEHQLVTEELPPRLNYY